MPGFYPEYMPALMAKLKEHGILASQGWWRSGVYLAQNRKWSLHVADGKIYRDNKGLAWVEKSLIRRKSRSYHD